MSIRELLNIERTNMNERDKNRVSELIRREFAAKRAELSREASDEDVSREAAALAKRLRIDADIRAYNKAAATKRELSKKLGDRIATAQGKSPEDYRSNSWDDALNKMAQKSLADKRSTKKQVAAIEAEERRLLSAVAVATTNATLQSCLKQAGLL